MIKIVFFCLFFGCITAQVNNASVVKLLRFPGEDCYRDCNEATPRTCYFHWHLEHYHVLGPACGSCGEEQGDTADCFNVQCVTADGLPRGVMSINRKIPGPDIHVCKNDMIVVDVTNQMGGTSATIHWHGFHQRATPFMDGVPFVTQCPIDFATTFRYSFRATEAGTQFYHSHSGHHKVNGHYGGIVVRQPFTDDPNFSTYDVDMKEHLIVASDWMEFDAEMWMPGLRSSPIGITPTNLLINGKGTIHNKKTGRSTTRVPLEVFRVQRGQRYRFRFVNSMSHVCPALLQIEGHSMLVIASDSYDVQPVTVDALISTPGERYDFVVEANQRGDHFWIRLRGLGPCERRQVEQFAVLSYAPESVDSRTLAFPLRAFPDYIEKFGQGRCLNHPDAKCARGDSDSDGLCITDLSSYVERPDITDVVPDYSFVLGFDNQRMNQAEVFGNNKYGHFMSFPEDVVMVGAINKVSFAFPPFSLLTQPSQVAVAEKQGLFCDEDHLPERCNDTIRKNNAERVCQCVHRLKVKKDAIVEIVVVDETPNRNVITHPFHLHGYPLFVMSMGGNDDGTPMTVAQARKMSLNGQFSRNETKKHPIKDTIAVTSKGYAVFRFKADNPGWWLLHCHYEWHMAVGMGLVLQVGEPDEMVQAPKGFPKCGNYKPDIYAEPDVETPAAGSRISRVDSSISGADASISPSVESVSSMEEASIDESLGLESVEPFTFVHENYKPFYENISP